MAFKYHSENGNTLSSSQEELLEMIENLPSPFEGISRLKDLRVKTKLLVYVSDSKDMLESCESYMEQYKSLHDVFYHGEHWQACHGHQGEIGERRDFIDWQVKKGRNRKTSLSRTWFLFSAFIRERITGGVGHIDQRLC